MNITLTRRARLGVRLHPEAVTAGWYAQDCPWRYEGYDTSALTRRVRAQWWLSRKLRGLP